MNVVHNFNQIQSVIYYSDDLNRILGFPIMDGHPDMTLFWNGAFIYNLYTDISNYRDRNERIKTLLNNNESVTNVVNQAWSFLASILIGFNDESISNVGGRQTKKNKKNKSKQNQDLNSNQFTENEIHTINKFQALAI